MSLYNLNLILSSNYGGNPRFCSDFIISSHFYMISVVCLRSHKCLGDTSRAASGMYDLLDVILEHLNHL
jgi:hypothetical protein